MPIHDLVRQGVQPLTAALTANRILLYGVLTTAGMLATILNACRDHSNFYSVMVYLSRSGRSLLLLANFGFLSALLCGRIMQRIFFGPLQPREVERLYDQTWMFVTESLLAFTIFRDEFDIPFVIMFGFLLFVKCFHWLMADRIESMDQTTYPGPPTLFHIRIVSLFVILWGIDLVMFALAIESTFSNGVGGMVLFASEYAILLASGLNAMARYALSVMDFRRARSRGGENAPPWEHKSMYIFYIELVTDFLKLATYLAFFMIILTFYGLPLNIIRDVYLTARSFITRLRALIRYHNATRDMDRRYPNATEEELSAMSDRTCIICREEMIIQANTQPIPPTAGQDANPPPEARAPDLNPPNPHPANHQDGPNVTPKKLPCGHIFHFQCLRSWLERQQSCPTCRRTVLETNDQNRTGQQQQAPAAPGARPPVPQPGQAPQPGQQAAGVANPLGWLGRILGVAAQPPLVPGQFPNGFMPPGVPGAPPMPPPPPPGPGQAQPAWMLPPGQFVPPGYGYPYQYPVQVPPHQLQQPPMFRGFYGPGGAWQPWGADGQWAVPVQQAPVPAQPQQMQEPPPAAGNPESGAAPLDTGSAAQGESPAAPRAAAAEAALRRLQSLRPSVSTRPSATRTTSGANDAAAASTSAQRLASEPTPSTSSSSSTATPTTTATATKTATVPTTATTSTTAQAPPLIPLYDPAAYASAPHPSGQVPVGPGSWSSYGPSPYTAYRPPPQQQQQFVQNRAPGTSFRPGPYAHAHARGASLSDFRPVQQQQRVRLPPPWASWPLERLPETLTEEELGRLDRVTREAIDERLRVLENVSGAVWRCVEELTRVRSALPASSAGSGASDVGARSEPGPSASEAEVGVGEAEDVGEAGAGSGSGSGSAASSSVSSSSVGTSVE